MQGNIAALSRIRDGFIKRAIATIKHSGCPNKRTPSACKNRATRTPVVHDELFGKVPGRRAATSVRRHGRCPTERRQDRTVPGCLDTQVRKQRCTRSATCAALDPDPAFPLIGPKAWMQSMTSTRRPEYPRGNPDAVYALPAPDFSESPGDEIDVRALLGTLLDHRRLIFVVTGICFLLALA